MNIDAIRRLSESTQEQIAEWTFQHVAGLARAQARYLTYALISFAIGISILVGKQSEVGFGGITVPASFFVVWYPLVLNAIAWGLLGTLAQTADAWPRVVDLLGLDVEDLGLYDVDPKPSLADHVMFLPKLAGTGRASGFLTFLSGFLYEFGYWGPAGLSWYMILWVMPSAEVDLRAKILQVQSIPILLSALVVSFYGVRVTWRRHVRKWVARVRGASRRETRVS